MMSLVSAAPSADSSNPKVLLGNGGGSGENSADPLQTPRALFPADWAALANHPSAFNCSASSSSVDDVHRLILEASSAPSSAGIYFPSTAELMMPSAETIRKANPFDLSFGKANRLIGANRTVLEANGLVPAASTSTSSIALTTSSSGGDSVVTSDPKSDCATTSSTTTSSTAASTSSAASSFLSKLQIPSALNHSPSIFTNIGLLGSATDGNENALKTADFARIVQQMKEGGGLSAQNSFMESGSSNAPKTADVLNAVLDIHMQMQQQKVDAAAASQKAADDAAAASSATLNGYLNATSLFNMPTPAGSAPNSAGILTQLAASAPSTQSIVSVLASVANANSQHLLAPQPSTTTTTAGQPSPRQMHELSKKLSPKVHIADQLATSSANGLHPSTSARPPSAPLNNHGGPSLMTALAAVAPLPPASSGASQMAIDPAGWDPHDVKPVVSGASIIYEHDPMLGVHQGGYHLDEIGGPRSNDSGSSSTRNSSSGLMHHSGHGRGRGRSTADMPPDERRQTILERNKAAAVRYRKRKKEEHDEMITRCQQMEQERATIIRVQTQNAVLRREVDRLTAIVKEREGRCHCLRGVTMPSELRERPPGDMEILEQCAQQYGGVHGAMAQSLMNGMHFGGGGGGGAKRPAPMHKHL